MTADYYLANDINCTGFGNFEPIEKEGNGFNGTFDGQGYKITHLYINRPSTDNVCLFGFTGSGSEIKDVELEEVDVCGRYLDGGLVGWNKGTITNSYWDIYRSNQSNCVGSGSSSGCTGKNAGNSEPDYWYYSTHAPMDQWDFDNIWGIVEGITYPYMRWQFPDVNCTCGDICVNETGWWQDGGAFIASGTPIQDAINNAIAGDTICVKDGTYNETVDVTKSDLTIRSENGPSVTTVSAYLYPDKHVFYITEQTNVTLEGFEIRDAHGTNQHVAGIYMDNASECKIFDNIVTNISATNGKAALGIRLYYSSDNNSFSSGSISNINAPIWWDFYSQGYAQGNSAENITISSFPTTISSTYENGIMLKSVQTPPADPAGKQNISKYVHVTEVTANSWIFMDVSYEEGDLGRVAEDSLRIWTHNGSDWTEVPGTNGINTAENYVYANITEFSVFAPLGYVTDVNLEINKTGVPNPVPAGGTLNYTIHVNNTGNATATNVTVTETYDKNVTFISAVPAPSSGDDTWQFPTLNVGETKWINIYVAVNASVLNETVLHNIVNVSCDEGVSDSDAEDTTVLSLPVCIETATGTGTAYFITDSGSIKDLTAVSEATLPLEGKPNLQFPHGFFSFNITGLTPRQTVTVTIILPEDMPTTNQY